MRNSMDAARKHALLGEPMSVIWRASRPRTAVLPSTGVMKNATEHLYRPALDSSPACDAPAVTASSASRDDSAHAVRGPGGKPGRLSPLRGAQVEGHRARFGLATCTRTCSRALAFGMRGAHAVVVCGQGLDRALGVARRGGRGKPPRSWVIPRPDVAAALSGERGRRGAVSKSACRADGGPRRLRPEATR
jgi:hypothetical protein